MLALVSHLDNSTLERSCLLLEESIGSFGSESCMNFVGYSVGSGCLKELKRKESSYDF